MHAKPGPIEGLFYARFHPTLGPVVVSRFPPGVISNETFDKLTNYIIPKPEVLHQIVCVKTQGIKSHIINPSKSEKDKSEEKPGEDSDEVPGIKIKGYPNRIEDPKYVRNALLFNICFIFKPEARTGPYDPVIQKISEYLCTLEIENNFLSDENSIKQMPFLLAQIMHELNSTGICILKVSLQDPLKLAKEEAANGSSDSDIAERRLSVSRSSGEPNPFRRVGGSSGVSGAGGSSTCERTTPSTSSRGSAVVNNSCGGRGCILDRENLGPDPFAVLYLKVIEKFETPSVVGEEQVPLLLKPEILQSVHNLDLTTQQIISYIDGVAHVAKIAHQANVELDLAKKCLQNLVYYEIVTFIDIFQYSNIYVHDQSKMKELYHNTIMQEKCLNYVLGDTAGRGLIFDEVFNLYSKFTYGHTVRDFCFCELKVGITAADQNETDKPKKRDPLNRRPPNVDVRRLVTFGVIHGLLKRWHQYPVYEPAHQSRKQRRIDSLGLSLRRYCDGTASMDLLCSKFGLSYRDLFNRLSRDKDMKFIAHT